MACPIPLDAPTILAPMAGITDVAFRTVMRRRGSAVSITELVSADGLVRGGKRTLELMAYEEEERPFGVQLFGRDDEILLPAIEKCQEHGADFIDINMGCPVRKVVSKGAGSAMSRDPEAMGKILERLVRGMDIPLTIKIRTGWDADTINAIEVVQAAEAAGCAWVAVHGRTRAQAYKGWADWDYIAEVAASVKIPVIGNGDILDAEQVRDRLAQSGCAGVMVGRGVLRNPWLLVEANALLRGEPAPTALDFVTLLAEQRELLERHTSERHTLLQLKKFSMWYSFGFPGSRRFRKDVFSHDDPDRVFEQAQQFFASVAHITPHEKDRQPFLKGGHG